jgi:hypothetical protein
MVSSFILFLLWLIECTIIYDGYCVYIRYIPRFSASLLFEVRFGPSRCDIVKVVCVCGTAFGWSASLCVQGCFWGFPVLSFSLLCVPCILSVREGVFYYYCAVVLVYTLMFWYSVIYIVRIDITCISYCIRNHMFSSIVIYVVRAFR